MKTVGYIFNCRTPRVAGFRFEDWVGVYFCDLKEPMRFTTLERATGYAHEQWLELQSPPLDYLQKEWWWPLDEEDWTEVKYRMAQLDGRKGVS